MFHVKLAGLFLILFAMAATASAQNLESAVMPGPVIKGHADQEGDCAKCHVRFDRAAQPRLCLDCHKAVRGDVAGGGGYHGRLREQGRECRSCHTEHKGRGAKIVFLDEKKFDHRQTDFALRGKHKGRACDSCHRPGVKHRDAPGDCNSCHRKDDKHKGGLGAKCGNCHGEDTWKDGRFDHGKTKFPLRRGHAGPKVKCESCHVGQDYTDTPRECTSCHRDEDMKDGHKGHFGTRCEKCHDEGEWALPTFRHERDTHYPLLDRHRLVDCMSCHRAPLFRSKTPTRCVACHRDDDVHKNSLGDTCDKCHSVKGWKGTSFDHDADTKFALRDKHKTAKCVACHKDQGMREKLATKCLSCHEKDDREKGHKGNFGDKCETCHDARSFDKPIFDHGRDAKYVLEGKHQKVKCASCHRGPLYRSKTDTACYACHKKEDVHFASFGLDCESCHVTTDWRKIVRRDAAKGRVP